MQLIEIEARSAADVSTIMSEQWSKHKISPVAPGTLDLRLRSRALSEEVSLNSISYGCPVRIDPVARDEVILLKMPLRGQAISVFSTGDVLAAPDCFSLVDVRRVSHVHCSGDLAMLVLRIRISRLSEYIENALGTPAREDLRFAPEMRAGSAGWEGWAPLASALAGLDARRDARISQRILEPLEEAVVATLLMSQPNNYLESLLRPAPSIAPAHVRRAEDYIYANAGRPLTTEAVALKVGVSVRALFDGFKSFRGTTPADFIRKVRLEQARADLLMGEETVSRIASKWGFGHSGNFARLYRDRFREAPSQTMRFGTGAARL